MKRWIRKFLGLAEFEGNIIARLGDAEFQLLMLRNDLTELFHDEHSEKRKAISDQLGAATLKRLRGEDMARRMTVEGNG